MAVIRVKSMAVGLGIALQVTLSGCASIPGAVTRQVDQHQMEFALTRHATPVVVFEHGLGGSMDWWAKVYPEIARDYSTFAYNRPGYGGSEDAQTERDGMHIVDELRALLKSQDLAPPYVLVGHSLGGLYMQLYARSHPEEVASLILVDSTHPHQVKGKGVPANWPVWARLLLSVATSDVVKKELDAVDRTGDNVMALPPFTGKPVLVLSATKPMQEKSELADDSNEKRRDIARLYPGSKQIWVDSGHGIPLERPDAVIDAIREVMSAKPALL